MIQDFVERPLEDREEELKSIEEVQNEIGELDPETRSGFDIETTT